MGMIDDRVDRVTAALMAAALPEDRDTVRALLIAAEALLEDGPARSDVQLDPEAPPTRSFNLRLNDYQLDLIRRVSKMQRRSQMNTIRLLLLPALEAAARGG